MSGIRQCLAVAIIFYCSKYVIEEWKISKFLLGSIVAFTIHRSAILAVLFLIPRLFTDINLKKLRISQAILICFLPLLGTGTLFLVLGRYSVYFHQENTIDIGIMGFVRVLLLFVFFFCIKDDLKTNRINERGMLLRALFLSEIMVVISIFSSYFADNMWRFGWYFWLYTPVTFAFLVNRNKEKEIMAVMAKALIVVVIGASYYGIMIWGMRSHLIPYTFFWQV